MDPAMMFLIESELDRSRDFKVNLVKLETLLLMDRNGCSKSEIHKP
jgi:hypothetical protein